MSEDNHEALVPGTVPAGQARRGASRVRLEMRDSAMDHRRPDVGRVHRAQVGSSAHRADGRSALGRARCPRIRARQARRARTGALAHQRRATAALISGATPIVGALTLALTHRENSEHEPSLAVARPIWHVLIYVSLASAAFLLFSLVGAARPHKLRESSIPDSKGERP